MPLKGIIVNPEGSTNRFKSKPLCVFLAGYIGSVIAEFALKAGHTVRGLARSEASAEKLRAKGVDPVIGDLHTLDVLREEAQKADAGKNF